MRNLDWGEYPDIGDDNEVENKSEDENGQDVENDIRGARSRRQTQPLHGLMIM